MKIGSILFIAVIGFIWFSKKYKGSSEPISAAQVEEKIFISPEEKSAYHSKIDMKAQIDKKLNRERIGKNKARASSDFFNRASSNAKKTIKSEAQIKEQEEEIDLVEDVQLDQEVSTVQKTRVVYIQAPKEASEPLPDPVKKPVYRRAGFKTVNGSDSQSNKNTNISEPGVKGVELRAVVQRDGNYKSNDVVRLRTISEVVINGIKIPKNTYLDGVANVNENRIFIVVKGYTVNGRYVNRNLQAYSLTGGRGLQLNTNSTKGAGKDILTNGATQVAQRVKLPINLSGTAGSLAKEKVEEQSAKLSAGTKMVLKTSV